MDFGTLVPKRIRVVSKFAAKVSLIKSKAKLAMEIYYFITATQYKLIILVA